MTGRTAERPLGAVADPLEDRPLGPVFETRFTVDGVRVHLGVVRGAADVLEDGRARAEELLGLWSRPRQDPDVAETLLLLALGRSRLPELSREEQLLVIGPALTADLVVRDMIDDGALGACAKVGDDAAFVGVPPRIEGWRVEVPDADERPQVLHVTEGGVSTRGRGPHRVSVTADHAWRAATEAERLIRGRQPTVVGTGSRTRSAPA